MLLRRSSSVTSPGPITLMPALSRPRSAYCFMKLPPWPAGTNTKIASGLASFMRWRNGAKSGLASGVVLEDDFHLLAGDGVALLLHVELDRVLDLLAG